MRFKGMRLKPWSLNVLVSVLSKKNIRRITMRKLILALLLAFSTTVFAETTGNNLYAQLTASDASVNLQGFAYIEGVLDSEDWYLTTDILSSMDLKKAKLEKFKIPHICFGNNKITLGHSRTASATWASTGPIPASCPAPTRMPRSLLESFACANNPE